MKEYGVVLGGGGAKGGYEIGVWKALRELSIPIKAVTGTSVGALNGAIMVQGDFELAEKLWTGLTIERIINVESEIEKKDQDKRHPYAIINTIKNAIISGGLDITPLKKLIEEIIDEEKIRKSNIDLGIVTFSLTDFKPIKIFKEDIPKGELVDYLLASSCFPAFKRQEIDNKLYIDGGIYDNLPISLMAEKNIRDIIAVDISGPGMNRRIDLRGFNVINIKNSEDLGRVLEFDGERSSRNIEIGYFDALKAFGRYSGAKYYIIPDEKNKCENNLLQSIKDDDLKKLYSFFGLEWGIKLPVAYGMILNKITRSIKQYSPQKISSSTIIQAMAEITAEQMDIDRLKPYTLEELAVCIIERYQNIKNDSDFQNYVKGLGNIIVTRNQKEFDREAKKILINGKFLPFYMPELKENDERVKMFRRFIAVTFPKICIANMFISLILSRQEETNM